MPCDIFLYATVFCDYFDSVFAVGITRDGQQLAVFRHTLVFLNNMSGNFQQTNVTFCTRFLAFGLNPQMTIKRDFQILFRQVIHVRPAQPCECAENKQVTYQFVAFLLERAINELCNFFFCQETPFGFFLCDAVPVEGIAL